MKENTFAQTFLDLFDDSVEKSNELTTSEKETISATFPDQEQLSDSLPMLLEKVEGFNNNIETANTNIKKWQETKKMWQARKDQLLEILGKAMERLHIPGKSLKADGIKLSSRSGSVVEFDEDWMLQQYQQLSHLRQGQTRHRQDQAERAPRPGRLAPDQPPGQDPHQTDLLHDHQIAILP